MLVVRPDVDVRLLPFTRMCTPPRVIIDGRRPTSPARTSPRSFDDRALGIADRFPVIGQPSS